MKFYVYNEELDVIIQNIVARIKHLKIGEVSSQLEEMGINYRLNYGVSLVHLRSLAKEFAEHHSFEIADRLWHLEYRETLILATMLVNPSEITDSHLDEWTKHIDNVEIAEQIAFNLLGKRKDSEELIEKWIYSEEPYVRYAALMSIGWQYRDSDSKMSPIVTKNINHIFEMISNPQLSRAATNSLKMAGRFDESIRENILSIANKLLNSEDVRLKQAGEEIIFEIEMA